MAVGYLHNVHKMMETAEEVRNVGFSVFIPAIDLLCGIKHGYNDYHEYFDNSQPWLMAADAVFLVPGWEDSEGTMKEIQVALKLGIPVYSDLTELIEAEINDEFQEAEVTWTKYDDDDKPTEEVLRIMDILKTGLLKAV